MPFHDYCVSRLTEVQEIDTYVCESKYVENEKLIRKLHKTTMKVSTVYTNKFYFLLNSQLGKYL